MNLEQQLNMKALLKDAKDICCSSCDGKIFREVTRFKKVSKFTNPNLKDDAIVPIPVYRCDDCGAIPEELMPSDWKSKPLGE